MEVSTRSLGILAGLALALSSASLLMDSGGAKVKFARTVERREASALADSVTLLAARIRAGQVRALVDSASRQPEAPTLLVIGDSVAPLLVQRADTLRAALGLPVPPLVPFRMALVDGRLLVAPTQHAFSLFTLLPVPGGVPSCTAVAIDLHEYDGVFSETLDGPKRWWPVWDGAVGPCWFLATFGEPGREVGAWLDARYWDVAGEIPGHRRQVFSEEPMPVLPALIDRLTGEFVGALTNGSATLEGCANDKPALCEVALLDHPYEARLLPPEVVGSGSASRRIFGRRSWILGVPSWASNSLLAMMAEDLGPTRFASFWSSSLPVSDAFRQAAGQTLGNWYQAQIRRELKRAGRVPAPGPARGSAFAVLALALGGTLLAARRRQVR